MRRWLHAARAASGCCGGLVDAQLGASNERPLGPFWSWEAEAYSFLGKQSGGCWEMDKRERWSAHFFLCRFPGGWRQKKKRAAHEVWAAIGMSYHRQHRYCG